jgi:hypothetical protein
VLKYIDILIGVALVMLGISLIITVITQIVSFAANFRGRQLRAGLAELLSTLPTQLAKADALAIATKLLHHDLLADGLGRKRLAPAVSREDLVNLLATPALLEKVLGKDVAIKLSTFAGDVDRWFEATMSRVANRFALQTRIVTVIAGSIMALVLHLDVFGLVRQLSADSDLRASLVGAAGTMLGNAQEVLSPPTLYHDAAVTLAGTPGSGLPTPPAAFTSRDEAEAWIRGQVSDPAQAEKLVASYETLLQQAVQAKIPHLLDKAVAIKVDLERAQGFSLIPEPYHPFEFGNVWAVLGVLTSAALLSLGAPFWFNLLKTASNLRPAIAAYVENRAPPEAPADQPAPAAPPQPPPVIAAPPGAAPQA